MTDATPNQPTGSGTWIWRKPLTRDVVDCAQFAAADPRDVRIAQLEAALREVRKLALVHDNRSLWDRLESVGHVSSAALRGVPSPERDMTITVEELDA